MSTIAMLDALGRRPSLATYSYVLFSVVRFGSRRRGLGAR